ncbi:hypothetical protein J2S43_003709 [Catenuloplanes nepalensis]|uniref:EVE domain-containing protein n=1 Tax=Catenuloplanes nepalensis TaxID=587533 RepID=A0ABT9MUT0_9ACTN|nr:EVE domain-containing protein [Catenuloplanes nepalensis]MDP9795197.1 hypothetical protein [Catenuloplanes nepalensis]
MAHWLVQANAAAWREREDREVREWCVKRYRDRVAAGDDIGLWLTGGVGLVAIGRVTGPPYRWADGSWHAPVEFARHFFDDPVSRAELLADPGFAGSAILRMPGAANPFPITDGEWRALLAHETART